MTFELEKAAQGMVQSGEGFEGFVFHLTGPGEIMVQTRNQAQLLAWINTEIGGRE